jgi:hypothetical protein
MRKTLSLVALGIVVTTISSLATYWVMVNEDTAAIAEIFICFLVAIMILASPFDSPSITHTEAGERNSKGR